MRLYAYSSVRIYNKNIAAEKAAQKRFAAVLFRRNIFYNH